MRSKVWVLFALWTGSLLLPGQVHGEVIISEVMYNPPQGKEYEYIEIHNRGPQEEDIGNWVFTEGILYVIPPGTRIPSGGYLVVCASKSSFQAAYPGVDGALQIGDHGSALKDGGERITLENDRGEVQDTFRYDDDTPWDFLADGFGASLERVCFTADPELPENWRASPVPQSPEQFGGSPAAPNTVTLCPPEELPRPRIHLSEIMYHPVKEQALDDEHEFIEIHNAGDVEISLAGWRIAGGVDFTFPENAAIGPGEYRVIAKNRALLSQVKDYNLNVSEIYGDYNRYLDNGGEKLALIGADGQGIESTTYDDDFPWPVGADGLGADEEWLRSSLLPILNHQYMGISLERVSFDFPAGLVYNWAPSPVDGATPGRPNASARLIPLPVVVDLAAEPVTIDDDPLIRSGDEVQIRARILPAGIVTEVVLEYFIDNIQLSGEPVLEEAMYDDGATANDSIAGDGEYSALLPARPDNTIVRYRILADRGSGLEIISPRPTDPNEWHAYFVSPLVNTNTRLYQIQISPQNWGRMWTNVQNGRVNGCTPNPTWNSEVSAVFIHEGKVFDAFVRYQGSRWNRTNGLDINNWPYPRPSTGPLRAISWRISLPRYAQLEGRSVLILNKLTQGCPGLAAGVGYRLFEMADVPAPTTRYIRLHVNGGYYHYMMEYERWGEELMRRYHREMSDRYPDIPPEKVGNLHKSMGCNCDEGPYGWGDWRRLFPNCTYDAYTRYQWTYDRKTHGWADSYELVSLIEDLNDLRTAYLQSRDPTDLRAFFEERFDLDLLLNYMAIINWSVPFDDMFQNHFIYQRLSDGKWIVGPWDLDQNFGVWKGANASIYMGEQGNADNRSGWWHYMKDAFLKVYRPEFEQRLLELTNTILHPNSVFPLVDQVLAGANLAEASQAPGGTGCNYSSSASVFKNFASQRFNVITSLLKVVEADAGPDQTVFTGATVQFDASNSRPDPGPGVTYSWSNGMTGEKPTFIFTEPGIYEITLTITVVGEIPGTDTVVITVNAPPEEAFVEKDGQVVLEAENFYLNSRHDAPFAWWEEDSTEAGYSGAGYMLAAEERYSKFTRNFTDAAPELRYTIQFENTGTYRVWIRGLSKHTAYDSCHVGLDRIARDETYAHEFQVEDTFQWSGDTRLRGPQELTVSEPGLHFFSIWIRETGQIIDKIILTKDTGFTPADLGPEESEVVDLVGPGRFIRGDVNGDRELDLPDIMSMLFYLFLGSPLVECEDHGDTNDDGQMDTSDVIYLLNYLFIGGPAPRAPFPDRGYDETPDAIDCGNAP